jgi:hypothetical protein
MRTMRRLAIAVLGAAAFVASAPVGCAIDGIPGGLRATPPGSGPQVVFDLLRRPLPEIPFPNDIATIADPTSRTGVRINASMIAPTQMESAARADLDTIEGWGIFAPLSVSFAKEAGQSPTDAAIDLQDVAARMQGDSWDLTDDPVYVVNLTTGVPVLLDMGNGNFPLTVWNPDDYYPNDPRATEGNLVFETFEEGAGLSQSDYRPSLDTDFDGVLDHPDTFGTAARYQGIDNLMTWYERQDDALVMRPILPMDEKTEYAVVLTDRLQGADGQPVRSPFPFIYHPTQESGVRRLQGVLGDPTRANYYGDIAGTGLAHVAFAWTFTTQPVQEDMVELRDGIYGKGKLARLEAQFPPIANIFPAAGKSLAASDEPGGWQKLPECLGPSQTPYVIHWADAKPAIEIFISQLFSLSPTALAELEGTLDAVDYFVVGTFAAPYLVGSPTSVEPEQNFHMNFATGEGDVATDQVHFWLAVPKATGDAKAPFPVAYWQHGTGLFDTEMFIHAGHYAQQGIALAAIDAPGHGLTLTSGQRDLAQGLLQGQCLAPFTDALDSGRAIDLNGDGIPDSGGLIWSAHILRTRDNVRQGVLDAMGMTRVFKSFDGVQRSTQDYNGDGTPDLAGDFNGDGIVDVGGPTNRYFSSGGSLGGIIAQVLGAVDPSIVASAPVSGAAGFLDVALRGIVAPTPVLEQTIGPLIVAVPATSRPPNGGGNVTQCSATQQSVRWVINDLFNSLEIEVACLDPSDLSTGMTVIVTDTANHQVRCARTLDGGAFRVPIPVSIGDPVVVEIYDAPDAVESYDGCVPVSGAPFGRRIDTWEQAATQYGAVASPDITCPSDAGCAQFRETFFPVGSQLVAPQEGIALFRQSPEFRKFTELSQGAMDAADPVAFAPYYMLKPLPGLDGTPMPPRPLLNVTTYGDNQVTTAAGLAFSRAAGALPFLPPRAATTMPEYADYATPQELYDALGSKTPNQALIDSYVVEGLSRLGRTPVATCGTNYIPASTNPACTMPPTVTAQTCADTLYDSDWLGETQQTYGQLHASPPIRLARVAGVHTSDAASLTAAWAPRILGVPMSADGSWPGGKPLVGSVSAYMQPLGQHDWSTGDSCDVWDGVTYMDGLLARFFSTSGQDLYYLTHAKTHECLSTGMCNFAPN